MKSSLRRALSLGAAVVAACAMGVSTAGPASAAPTNSVASICGSGYKWVAEYPVTYRSVDGQDRRLGTAYLGYNSANGYACAYTFKRADTNHVSFYGSPTWMVAKLGVENRGWAVDDGNYSYFAGPVYKYARGARVTLVADVGLDRDESWAHLALPWKSYSFS